MDDGLGEDAKKLIRKFVANSSSVDRDDLIDQIKEKREEVTTFMKLPFTIMFFCSFALFALGHEHIGDSSMVQREIRGMVEGTTYEGVWATSGHKDMFDIDTKEDIYNYLKEAIVPLFIRPIATPQMERHRALRYNRIIGGVVLQQIRRKSTDCATEYPTLGPFTTKDVGGKTNPILKGFDCFPWTTEEDNCFGPPFSGAAREGFCPDSKVFEDTDAAATGGRRMDFVTDGGGSGGSSKGKMPAPSNRSYYSVYLHEYEGLESAIAKLNTLEADGWVDYNTAWMGVRILILNPGLEIFMHTTINVYMPPSGAMLPKVTAQSFQPEPYISMSVLAVDGFFAMCVCVLTIQTLQEIRSTMKQEKCKEYLKNAWNWLDLLVVMLSLMIGMLWVTLVGILDKTKAAAMDARESEPIPGQTSDVYPQLVADMHAQMNVASEYLNIWRLCLCWYTLTVSLKFLESFSNQPRLAVVTKTILRAGPDFFHFFIVCCFIFFSFVVSGMFIFGRRLWNWSSITLATNECVLLMMGDFDYDEMTAEHPMTAAIWFWAFIFLIMQILLNMLMAIIMDVYTEVKADASGFATVWAQVGEIFQDNYNIIMGKTVSATELLKVLEMAPEEEFDVEVLMKRVGPGLALEQAEKMIEDTKQNIDNKLQGSVSMTDAIRMIAWVKIAVQKIETKMEDLVIAETLEKAEMLKAVQAQKDAVKNLGTIVAVATAGPAEAYLQETADKIDGVEARLRGMESVLQETMGVSGVRGKDLRDRMQTIEDLLRGQRDAMVRSGRDTWGQR